MNLMNDHGFTKFSQPNFMLKIDLESLISILKHMECSWLDERLQNLAVVAHSNAPFVHGSCAVAMYAL